MIKPLQDNLVLETLDKAPEETTASGIFVPGSEVDIAKQRKVIAVGPDVKGDIAVGDTVLLSNIVVKEKFEKYDVVKEDQILGVIS